MKFAIISGASKGIGKAIALKFAKQGYDVAITTYKDQKNLYKVQKEIIDLGVSCIAEICDMSDYNSCKLFFEEITKKYKNIDVLINNAGISYFGLLQDMSYEAWFAFSQIFMNKSSLTIFNSQQLSHSSNLQYSEHILLFYKQALLYFYQKPR